MQNQIRPKILFTSLFFFLRRIVNKSTILKNWKPKDKMMFAVLTDNFTFGLYAIHLKILVVTGGLQCIYFQ